jgi:trans-aconitate 2-methyltransferase
MPWDPNRYEQFSNERYAPFDDLSALIAVRPGLSVVDLGCGTGELTRRLAGMLPSSDVTGFDASAEMLEAAAPLAQDGLRFEQRRVEDVDGSWDVVFSNAALQWVDGHSQLIPRLWSMVRPGGQLVVQVPFNFRHPSHTIMSDLAREEPFRTGLGGWDREWPVLPVEQYAEMLFANGATGIVAFEKVYPHILDDADAMADWMMGTALVPYLEHLVREHHESFLAEYRARLRARFPSRPVFFGFRRTLFAGTKPA